ncbi:Bug family tripartite tricarboxylate transporter substrate binding protein [Pararoseomonas indoligenes]|uniref:Tripartite tricarboxylate transporter substrate binding protein n=1 Tax=Roseomonas indoligenes TaxID=2820811 RepID=A0A940MX86_9PROT|nr:tripartite tricarboxylate transporter substrate-binding protein [Pararoseomonas indoligenes]MBP0492675.1 tripartite tricarboxylate transporter substrate binding protein [Pararoseomonas indoligenes]
MRSVPRRTALFLPALLAAGPARAEWPDRPVRIIAPFAPGGSSDLIARLIGTELQTRLGQPVVVENRGGANGAIGMAAAAQAPADGYTLVQGHIGTHAITPAIMRSPGYDTLRDFTTVAIPATSSSVLVVPQASPVRDLKGLLDLARARPGELSYGSPGIGSPSHVTVVLLSKMTGINAQHVPYRGGGPAVTDLVGGTLDFMFAGPSEVMGQVQSGRLRALATTGEQRSPGSPHLPTVAEAGVPGFRFTVWHALSVRAGTPPALLQRLRQEVAAIFGKEAIQLRLRDVGLERGPADAAAGDAMLRAEVTRWGALVHEAGIQAE